jgi:hypothetical protein
MSEDDQKPWEAEGVSRRTWFRRKREQMGTELDGEVSDASAQDIETVAMRENRRNLAKLNMVWEVASEGVRAAFFQGRQADIEALLERAKNSKVHVVPVGKSQLDVPLTELELREYLHGVVPPFKGEVGPLRDKDGERLAGDRGSNPKPKNGD